MLQGKANVFQRLDDTADLFMAAGFADARSTINAAVWRRLLEVWAARHVFTHNDGLVDAKYLTRVPSSRVPVGQRLTVSEVLVRQAIADTRTLCDALVTLTTP